MSGGVVPARMDDLEVACGFVLGREQARRLPPHTGPRVPGMAREAFERSVLGALRAGPCVVSFSGGRDSSAVLAVASRIAAREGLDPPHAVTLRFAGVPSAEESAWQERVIAAVGVQDWSVLEITTELDLVGDLAGDQIRACGVLWPANTHFHAPVAALARGGTLVTGFGGDEILTPGWAWDRWNWVLTHQVRATPSDLVEAAGALGPRWLRRRVLARRPELSEPSRWLTGPGQRAVTAAWSDLRLAEPVRHDRAVREHWWGSRYAAVALDSLSRLATHHGAGVLHPFAEPQFLTALATERGRAGPRSRTRAMRHLFSDVLPDETLRRVGKATFNGAFWGPASRAFASAWDGPLDNDFVDVEALRTEWSRPDPDARTYPLLQSVWAAVHR